MTMRAQLWSATDGAWKIVLVSAEEPAKVFLQGEAHFG
jgi:hypothetical protein